MRVTRKEGCVECGVGWWCVVVVWGMGVGVLRVGAARGSVA